MLTIDGSRGEGGGQILRTALALSMCLQRPVRLDRIRASRSKPGLRRQHLTAVQAAARITGARVEGAALGAVELKFIPGPVRPGEYRFDLGTAGSTTLVLQTLLPALIGAGGASRVVLEGGTHNPQAPPFEFLQSAFVPLLNRMGARVDLRLVRPGFYPAGGGCIEADIRPASRLAPLELLERGGVVSLGGVVWLSALPAHIAERERRVLHEDPRWRSARLAVRRVEQPRGPGNAVVLVVECRHVTEVFAATGLRGVPAEEVAAAAMASAREYLDAGVPVGAYLADQLLLPLALAGAGRYLTVKPSSHTLTNMAVIGQFLDVPLECRRESRGWCVEAGSPDPAAVSPGATT